MTVLVTGATGLVGGHVLAGLLAHGAPVRATCRRPDEGTIPAGVPVVRSDLADPDSLRPALSGVDRIFLYVRRRLLDPLIAVLRDAGVEQVVLLSGSSAAAQGAGNDVGTRNFLRAAEQAIETSGMAYTFLRPGTFARNAFAWRDTIKADGTVALPYPDSVQVPIHEQDVADVAVAALTTDRLTGAAPILTGPDRITLREQVAAIGAAIGRELTVVEQTDAEARAWYGRFMPPFTFDPVLQAWRESVGAKPEISPAVESITGRPGRTFAQWAADHADLYR